MGPINVFARWRPLATAEAEIGEIDRHALSDSRGLLSITIKHQVSTGDGSWTSSPAFHTIFSPDHHNHQVYEAVVAPNIPKVLRGENCSFFAYGHSGSGKTHTILGYDFQDTEELGLCLAAAKQLFDALLCLNDENKGQKLGIGFSLFELRNKSAYDLLNNRTQCHVRQGPDGKVHIRGETEILEEGKVRVRPIVQRSCWEFNTFKQELVQAIGQRAKGSSSVHDQSSRTHAVLELEIISPPLVNARRALFDRQSELVPVGKRATDIKVEEESKGFICLPDGRWAPNPDYQPNQERIGAVEAEKAEYEARVTEAEEKIEAILASSVFPCLGAKLVFIDLAGAEYFEGNGSGPTTVKQTPQERQEGRQINTDLLALKEVMRAWSRNQKRIPFRASTLTMVLREHFISTGKGNSTIIVTLSPAENQYAATLNSLKYASLVGTASA
ncbi:kinesin family [Fusarium beomiforme]|uniref:Kinesin family n=1 Tax=Fusarium beomiforme TaxID=44412 RepID=A0A9P5A7F3_9HYPO|nr:kinesin family [Fusarium beomiforme]